MALEEPRGWLTAAEVKGLWPQAEVMEEPILTLLVAAAREQCVDYAPLLPAGAAVPETWRLAQLFQIQGLWQSAKAGPGDTIGPDGISVTVYPMDRTVKNLLRPKRGVPLVSRG